MELKKIDLIKNYWKFRSYRDTAPLPQLLSVRYDFNVFHKDPSIKIIRSFLKDNDAVLDIGAATNILRKS